MNPRLAALAVLALLASACGPGLRQVQVLHTTDVHGFYSGDAPAPDARPGGLRQLAALVDQARAQGPVLLIDSGDMWSGTLLADRREGAPGVAAFNLLRYDAAALGNHELDYGPIGPAETGTDRPFGALEARLSEATFPVLAANVTDKATGAPPAWPNLAPSAVVERGDLRFGLVGVATPDTPALTFPHVRQRLDFTDPAAAAAEAARLRREHKVDFVFLLAHVGGRCEDLSDPHDTASCDPASPLFQLVKALPDRSFDAVFGGHTHQQVAHWVYGVPVLQGGAYGQLVSRLDVRVEPDGRRTLTIHPPAPIAAAAETSTSRAVGDLLAPLEGEVAALRAEPLGTRLIEPLTRDWAQSSALGSFLCDMMLAQHPDREICLTNSGGLRADLPAGELTYGALYDAMPFSNQPAYLDITGAVLLELLRVGTSGAFGVVQVAGLQLTYDRERDRCPTIDRDGDGDVDRADRDRLLEARLWDGRPIDPQRTYRVVTSSFLALGGDGWGPALSRVHPDRVRVLSGSLPLRDALASLLRERRFVLNSKDRPAMTTPRVTAVGRDVRAPCP